MTKNPAAYDHDLPRPPARQGRGCFFYGCVRIESLTVRDGTLTIRARAKKTPEEPDAKAEPEPSAEPAPAPAEEAPTAPAP